ncbi:hypothetical protein P0Y35_16450 [Kiritimatiellaeota bacterium B1221]|nr:hypothetical protein [Kiritimatiellaeota bacterium B1221]
MKTLWILTCVFASVIFAAEVTVLPPHQFTEGEVAEIQVKAPALAGKRIQWRIGLEDTALASGGISLDATGEGRFTFEAPVLRTGDALPLSLVLLEEGTVKLRPDTQLWIFPKDPLKAFKERLQENPLPVYDPKGGTVDWLKAAEIPYERCFELEEASGKLLLIGEGISFKTHSELTGKIRKLAAKGMSVVCLQAEEGHMDLWNVETGPLPVKWTFAGEDFFEKRDKRLIASGLEIQSFSLEADRGQVQLQVNAEQGWSWAQFHFEGGGSFTLCGVKIIKSDIKSPAAQVLFEQVLTKTKNKKSNH